MARPGFPARPLLDRFLTPDRTGPPDLTEYTDIIRRDLTELLNTRAAWPRPEAGPEPPTVLDYGLADFTALSPRSGDDVLLLARALKRALESFEPRLAGIELRPPEPGADTPAAAESLGLTLAATLAGFEDRPEFIFELPLKRAGEDRPKTKENS